MSYTPPDSKLVVLTFTGAYTPPDSRMIGVDLIPPPTGNTQVLYPNMIGDYGVGAPSVQNTARAVYPTGADTAAFGTPAVANLSQEVTTAGATHTEFGTPEKVWNFRTFVREVSVGIYTNQQTHTVRNQHEYLHPGGINSLVLGVATTEREDRGRHTLRYVDYFGEGGAGPSGGVADFGFHTTDYVFRIADYTNGGASRAYYMHRYDRQTWATDGTPRYTEDSATGDFFYPGSSAGFVSLNGSVYLACRARRSDDSLYHAILQLDSAGEYVASVDTGLGVNDYIYAITAVGNRVYFCTRTALYECTGLVVSPVTSGSFSALRGNAAGLFSLALDGTVTRHDLNTGGVLASVTTDASMLAVTDHVVWVISGDATARAYDLALAPLSEVSVAMFAPQEGVADIAVSPRVSVSANLVAVSTSQSFVLLYGEAERQTVAGYFPVSHGGLVPSTLYEYNNMSLGYYSPPADYMYIPASPWPPETAVPAAVDLASYTRRQAFDALQLLSDTEAYLTMNDVFVVPHSGAGYLPPGWRVKRRAIIKASVHVSTAASLVLTPGSITPPAMDSRPSIRMQWQVVVPASAKHSVVNEVGFQLKNRQVSPFGIDPGFFGTPSLRNNLISPVGFGGAVVSMPDVTDKHQNLYPSSVVTIGMMGDIPTIWNYTQKVAPVGTDYAYFQNYQPTIENRNKVVDLNSLPIGKVGAPIVYNVALSFTPTSRDTSLFGQTELTNWVQYREPAGFNAALYGTLQIVNAAMVARPVPKDMSLFGTLEISLRTRVIELPSIDEPYQDSEPWVSPYVRSFGPLGKIAATLYGSPGVTHDLRYVAPPTFYPAVFGSTRVDLFRRTLTFTGIFFDTPAAALGTPRLSPRVQAIDTQPIDSASFGALHIARKELFAEVTGDDAQAFGAPEVDLYRRYVQMLTTDMAQYGEPEVWNWRTYVAPWSQDAAHGGYGTLFIELRNRVLAMRGTDLSKFSIYTDVSNKARLLPATGTDVSEFGSAMVADKVRRLYPDGEELERFGTWFTVHNVRQIVDTSGIPRPYAGVPRVWRNEQITDALGGISSAAFGLPMVAPRIRTVVQYRADDPVAGFPTVELLKRYIIPPGFTGNFGWTTVEGHRNEARIYGADYLRFGEPLIANFNPQAWPSGMDYEIQTSRPWVSFRVRTIDLDGGSIGTPDPSRPEVAIRTRTVRPSGMVLSIIPNTQDIRWDMPQLPAQRTLLPDGVGPVVVPDNPPKPIVGALILWPESGEQSSFGMVEVRANSVWPSSTYSAFSDVSAVAVTHKNRTIYINTKNTPAVFEPGRVRLFPAVIGPFGDDDPRNLIDAYLASSENPFTRPFWGNVTVTNQHRQVAILGSSMLGCGLPELRTNHVQLDGWDSNEGKFGMTDFAGPQYIEPFWGRTTPDYIPEVPQYNFDTAKYGEVNVHYPVVPPVWSPYINAAGGYMTQFGYVSVESTIRNIYPEGFSPPQVPSVWLHPPFHLYPEGFEPPVPAILLIAPRIRSVYPVGDDMALVCEEDVSEIASRMRVRHGTGRYAVDSVAPATITFGEISHRNRSLPVDTLPAEALPAVRVQAQNIVAPAGTDAALVGTIRRAVFGELYPYAPDMQGFGYPRMNRRALMAGITPEAVSPARIARPIRPAGSSAFASDTALAITNIYGCRDRAIIVNGETDFSSFGGANVTH